MGVSLSRYNKLGKVSKAKSECICEKCKAIIKAGEEQVIFPPATVFVPSSVTYCIICGRGDAKCPNCGSGDVRGMGYEDYWCIGNDEYAETTSDSLHCNKCGNNFADEDDEQHY